MSVAPEAMVNQQGVAPAGIQQQHNYAREALDRAAMRAMAAGEYQGNRVAAIPRDIRTAQLESRNANPYTQYLREAQQIRQRTFPQVAREYMGEMSPYVQEVARRVAEEGNENLTRNILPALDAKFSRLGQFGSTRHQQAAAQAARDIQRDITANQQKARLTGYTQAGELFGRDQAAALERANVLAKLAAVGQVGRESDINQLSKLGDYERQHAQQGLDVDYNDWLRRNTWDMDIMGKWVNANKDIPTPSINTNEWLAPAQAPVMNNAGNMAHIAMQALPLLFPQQPVQQPAQVQQPAAPFIPNPLTNAQRAAMARNMVASAQQNGFLNNRRRGGYVGAPRTRSRSYIPVAPHIEI